MAKDYKSFLAERVLNDDDVVTYRLVARAMGVHANEAKKMLFEFHRSENAKKAGSVHATYILSGFKKASKSGNTNGTTLATNGGDVEMRSSPFPGSSMPPPADESDDLVRSFTLAREDQLDVAKGRYQQLTGIHVYSIQPSSMKNLELISNANERIYHEFVKEDPLVKGKTWGLMHNPNAKRRTGARPPPPSPPLSATTSAKPKPAAKTGTQSASSAAKSSEPSQLKRESSSGSTTSSRPAAVKRESSNLFKSFAKSKPKEKPAAANEDDDIEVKTGGTDSSARGAHSMAIGNLGDETKVKEDVHMADDDDEDDDDGFEAPKAAAPSDRKTKAERNEELKRKLFEDDEDEDMPDADAKDGTPDEDAASPEEEAEAEDSQRMDAESAKQEEEPAEQATVSNGRRRGKRRVSKKRMIKDSEGYLVSREEMVWESFSEDDIPAAKPKTSAPASSSASKKGQPAKKGQGNIMSFFGKR